MTYRKTSLILCLLLAYSLFLYLKINGWLDFTGRYGLEQILCKESFQNNRVLMIDGDLGTTWGTTELHYPSEAIVFRFRKERPIASLGFTNTSDEPNVPIKVFGSLDGSSWVELSGNWSYDEGTSSFQVMQRCKLRFVKFEYGGEQAGHWPITEVRFDE